MGNITPPEPSLPAVGRWPRRWPASSPIIRRAQQPGAGRRILEVGPGTGAVTTALVRGLGPADSLDLVELNDRFVAHLRGRFEREPAFQAVGSRSRVLHQPLETLPGDAPYDLIVSGLPLNNFSVPAVEEILAAYRKLLRPGGTLSFFEYIAIRRARAVVSGRAERARLQGISQALAALFAEGRIAAIGSGRIFRRPGFTTSACRGPRWLERPIYWPRLGIGLQV